MCPKAEPFALAGVYDVWKGDGGKAITSFAIVTTRGMLVELSPHEEPALRGARSRPHRQLPSRLIRQSGSSRISHVS
jgi:hypothetical protein